MAKGKRLGFRVDKDLDDKLTQMCESSDCTRSEYIEAILREALEGGDDVVLKARKPSDKPAVHTAEIVQGKVQWKTTENGIPIGRVRH